MASKSLKFARFINPNLQKFRIQFSMYRDSAILQTRPYSDLLPQNSSNHSPLISPSPVHEFKETPTISSSLNEFELAKFSAIAETWWDSQGPFKPLHALNPTRLAFIRSTLCRHFRKDPLSPRPFEGLKFADVGCGGGILSEPLARMGATVTGVDAVERNIKIARLHAESDPATSSIEYCCTTAENLVEQERTFDAVLSLEVIEHVANPADFCKSLGSLTAPNGATLVSTINRSMRAYAATIVVQSTFSIGSRKVHTSDQNLSLQKNWRC